MNKVFLIGNIVRDIELKPIAGGHVTMDLKIAVDESRKVGDEWKTETTFIDVQCWGKMAESIHRNLMKGDKILVEGKYCIDTWKKDEQYFSKHYIKAFKVEYITMKKKQSEPKPMESGIGVQKSAPQETDLEDGYDSIPF